MLRRILLLSSGFVAVLLCGCPTTGLPNLCHPGTAAQQRLWAEQFDPYPATDVGPDVSGLRPRGFERSPSYPPPPVAR
ncbi:MAG: membrane or secreted protein [Pirellulales bacterium]|nr:membrane or secreted protein [Pirellulales bacterium]